MDFLNIYGKVKSVKFNEFYKNLEKHIKSEWNSRLKQLEFNNNPSKIIPVEVDQVGQLMSQINITEINI